jgi:hypothetical protein
MDEKQKQMRFADDFLRLTKRSPLGNGMVRIECPKGLWAVEGIVTDILGEAHGYFRQYWQDGEYD